MNPKDLDQRVNQLESKDTFVAAFLSKDWPELKSKLDEIAKCLQEIQITQVQQQASIEHHIRRTDLAETALIQHREESLAARQRIAENLRPVQTHIARVDGIFKFFGVLAVVAGMALAIKQLFQ